MRYSNTVSPGKRNRFYLVFVFYLMYSFPQQTFSELFTINPIDPPSITLPPKEAQQLKDLLSAKRVLLVSSVSPDNRSVLIRTPSTGEYFFLNPNTKAKIKVSPDISQYQQFSEFRWKNPYRLTTIGRDAEGILTQITINRSTGTITTLPLDIEGSIVSLSSKGTKILVARSNEKIGNTSRSLHDESVIKKIPLRRGYELDSKTKYVPMTIMKSTLYVIDIHSGYEEQLVELPENLALSNIEWSPSEYSLSIVRGLLPTWQRGGAITIDDDEVQDALGNLPIDVNPYYTSNAIEIFRFRYKKKTRHIRLYPHSERGEIFSSVRWSPWGDIFMAETVEPSYIENRTHPTYIKYSGTNYRFYTANGYYFQKLNRSEIDAVYNDHCFISPYEVIIKSHNTLSTRLYYYNISSRRLRRLPTPSGQIGTIQPFSNKSNILYEYNSYTQPYEVFSINAYTAQKQRLTSINKKAYQANRVRVDQVHFTLSNGKRRVGYIIQPQNASFPPQNVPLCVWQEGGPTVPMINQWSGNIEASHNILPNFGIATLMVPLPGRYGFGKDFVNRLADQVNFGQIDIDEQMEISQMLIDRGYTSNEKIGIYGMSYGGYFTSQTITTYPDFYAAANNQFSLINLFHEWEFGFMGYLTYLMGCIPVENSDEYFKDSPFHRVDNVRIPTLVYTSSNDFLPNIFSIQFHDKINTLGHTTSDCYLFLNEGHGLYQFNNQFVAAQKQIEWFRKYLAQ